MKYESFLVMKRFSSSFTHIRYQARLEYNTLSIIIYISTTHYFTKINICAKTKFLKHSSCKCNQLKKQWFFIYLFIQKLLIRIVQAYLNTVLISKQISNKENWYKVFKHDLHFSKTKHFLNISH